MNQLQTEIPRSLALAILSQERGREPDRPLDKSTISKWCADLGFEAGLKFFTPSQFEQLQAVNRHYARGGNRSELIQKLRRIQQW
jgi:hypothetical protein